MRIYWTARFLGWAVPPTFVDLGGGGEGEGEEGGLLLFDDNGLSYFWHNQDVIGAE